MKQTVICVLGFFFLESIGTDSKSRPILFMESEPALKIMDPPPPQPPR